MVHGPCGAMNRKSPCMIDGVCSKFYPKQFTSCTNVNEEGYPVEEETTDELLKRVGTSLIIDTLFHTMQIYFSGINPISILNGVTKVGPSSI